MDIKKIKFRREKDEFGCVTYWFDEGTKHLGPVCAHKHNAYYNIQDNEGGYLAWGFEQNIRTLKDVKEWIANYDDARDAEEARYEEETKRRAEELAKRREAEKKALKEFTNAVNDPVIPKVGDVVKLKMPKLNKLGDIGEYLVQLNDVTQYSTPRAKIMGVVKLTNEEWDNMVNNLLKHQDFWERDAETGGVVGGNNTDAPEWEDVTDFFAAYSKPEMKRIWDTTCYELVHAITAPNRRVFYVNNQGYDYARYVGFHGL